MPFDGWDGAGSQTKRAGRLKPSDGLVSNER
jgi:hypothetical protein